MSARRKRRWPWIVGAVVVVLLIPVAVLGVPILLHQDGGAANQTQTAQEWPTEVTATGDDGKTRELAVFSPEPGGVVDTSALAVGDRIVVTGTGFSAGQGIYVAICAIPADPTIKPGPCLGGVPESTGEALETGSVQWAPSNWISDDWGWKLFGARGFDDSATGTFTAYLQVDALSSEEVDCTEVACAIYTRNDHTALTDRVQDLYIPVGFAS